MGPVTPAVRADQRALLARCTRQRFSRAGSSFMKVRPVIVCTSSRWVRWRFEFRPQPVTTSPSTSSAQVTPSESRR